MVAITAKPKHGAQDPNSPSGTKPVLHSELFPVTGLLGTWREDGENESDINVMARINVVY
jgi:hypothetical protein